MESRPSRTGSLRRLRVRNRPEDGSTRTAVSLKEFVPISTAANKLLSVAAATVTGTRELVVIFSEIDGTVIHTTLLQIQFLVGKSKYNLGVPICHHIITVY